MVSPNQAVLWKFVSCPRILILCAVLALPVAVSAGDGEPENVRDLYETGLSLNLGGVVFGGASFDVFLNHSFNLEVCLGAIAGAGLRWHWRGADPDVLWSPYAGGYVGVIPDIDLGLFGSGHDDKVLTDLYLPVGVHYISRQGFSMAFEGGWLHGFAAGSQSGFDIPMVAVKAGFRF